MGDFSQNADSQSLYSLRGLAGSLPVPDSTVHNTEYAGSTNLKDPVLSPIYADLKGMPPALLITSTRDLLLSGTTILHRRFLAEGVDARLIVFRSAPSRLLE